MFQKTAAIKTNKPFKFSAKGVIQEPQLGILTDLYPIGEKEYYILRQRYWSDCLCPIAFASLGFFIGKLIELCAFVYKIWKSSSEDAAMLMENCKDEIGNTTVTLIISFIIFLALWLINKFLPTKKKKLLKNIREVLDSNQSIIAKKKGKTRD